MALVLEQEVKVQYSKANWQQGVDAQPSAQEVLKRDGWEEADYQT